jgi:cytochrome P450
MQIALARIVARYALEPVAGREVVPEPWVTLRPRGGLWIKLRQRTG